MHVFAYVFTYACVHMCLCERAVYTLQVSVPPQVMLAASYWSLLAPAIELAESSGLYGSFTFLPIALGFAAGAAFVYTADLLLPLLVTTFVVSVHTAVMIY